jgi:hypothetical protein
MNDLTPTNGEAPNPYEVFETIGELAAFVYRKEGVDGLRQLLHYDGDTRVTRWSREQMLDVADELNAAGLRKAAAITAEIAATKPLMTDMVFCPYLVPPYSETPGNQHNISCWLRAEQHRQQRWQRRRALKRKRSVRS